MKLRRDFLQEVANEKFDLIIIGGGIAGAGVAQNAASRGLKVALVEKGDFGCGTSGKTTKLIHGGLRYLENFQFTLTRQLCMERERLKKLAPHMIRDFSFVLPVADHSTMFGLKAGAGLSIYGALAFASGVIHTHNWLGRNELHAAAPGLDGSHLVGGLRFHDSITDDTRLVLAVLKSACAFGASIVNYAEVKEFLWADGRIAGVTCRDRVDSADFQIYGKFVVNATGVWSDRICALAKADWPARIMPSKGTHIVVPQSAFETNTALFLPTMDKRYVFVVPWQHSLMIGTTDDPYQGNIDQPCAQEEEINYLLATVNSYTTSCKLSSSQVTAAFAGLRPLVKFEQVQGDNDVSSMSREHQIYELDNGLINVAGGKLTSFRLMAEEVMGLIAGKLSDKVLLSSETDRIMLGGWRDGQDYAHLSAELSLRARKLMLEPATIEHLIANYGAEAEWVLDFVEQYPELTGRICPDFPPIYAEILHCIANEMAMSLSDILLRRLRLGVLHRQQCLASAPQVARLMQQILRWDNNRLNAELSSLEEAIAYSTEMTVEALGKKR